MTQALYAHMINKKKVLFVSLDVTSFDSFGELVIDCRTFSSLNIVSCLLVLKAHLNLGLLGLGQMPVNLQV
jgi:hypothetical protein